MATRTEKAEKAETKGRGNGRREGAVAATPWGPSGVVEEVVVRQQAGEKRFAVVVQLLETKGGERLIRFAYTTEGVARRGPVTMRARDLEKLRAALERAPALGEALGL
jgi:hypothetical protein